MTGQLDPEPASLDDEVLALRAQGRAFGTIAKRLGMKRSKDANLAFNRALRRRPPAERDEIRSAESERLDRVAVAVRADESLSAAETEKRLETIEALRRRLLAD